MKAAFLSIGLAALAAATPSAAAAVPTPTRPPLTPSPPSGSAPGASIDAAEKLLTQRKYAEAEAMLRGLVAADPRSARVHGNLALALLSQGKSAEAVDEGRLAAAFGPDLPEARYIYGRALAAAGRPAEAARELQKAVDARPDSAAPVAALAAAYAASADPRARNAYERWIVLEPAAVKPRIALAELYWRDGPAADGNHVAEAAMERFPANADLPLRYGRALLEQLLFADAAARLERARELGASGEAFLLLLGDAWGQAGRPDAATRVLAEAARLYPDSAAARGDYGRRLFASGRPAEALPELEAAARLDPRSAAAQLDLGRACEALGRLPEALAAYERAVTLAPNLPRGRYALGRLLLRLGRRAEAQVQLDAHKAAYDQGLKTVSQNQARTAELDLARARLEAGEAARALEIFAAMAEGADSLSGKAEALSRLNRHAEAVRALEKARILAPDDPRVATLLAAERSRAAEPGARQP